jgi:curved DNA-binding protein CbpA
LRASAVLGLTREQAHLLFGSGGIDMSHLYGVLGIPRDSDNAQVKSAYRALAKACHPDLRGGDERRFREIRHAYETLVDPARRAAYDAETAQERAMARRRLKSAAAMMAASFMLTVSSGMFVAGLLLGVQAN